MSAPPNSPGRTIRYFGDYLIVGEIGGGGMGIVYSAQQVSLNRPVALKLIRSGAMAGESERRRFLVEAEAAAKLDHPNIVPIFEIGTTEGQLFVSMKLIEGQSLAALIAHAKSEISSDAAAKLLVKIARAVHHAHQRGVLHRDIKPANILIDGNGEPHLADFGLAKIVERQSELRVESDGADGNSTSLNSQLKSLSTDQTLTGELLGTPEYMSPEQAAGRSRELTAATDLYNLGAVLYALLTGRPPLRGESPGETLDLVRKSEPPRPRALNPQVDAELETICLKCLEKEPSGRYASAAALADDLERWLQGEVILARPVQPWQQLGKWIRRHPARLSGLIVVGALLAANAGAWLWHRAQQGADGPGRRMDWQTVTGPTVETKPNTGYRIKGTVRVTLQLPEAPATGDVIRISCDRGHWHIRQSSNQVILTEPLGAGTPGWVWTPRASGDRQWTGLTSSANGKKLVAVEFGYLNGGGGIFTSADAGQTWTEHPPKRAWLGVASAATGQTLLAIAHGSRLYISRDSGTTWLPHFTNAIWTGAAISADGHRLVAVDNGWEPPGGRIHVSTDAGETWVARESNRHWHGVAMSADGLKLAAVEGQTDRSGKAVFGYVYTSADGGTNWTAHLTDELRRWVAVAISTDGRRIIAAANEGFLFVSGDEGLNWRATLDDRRRGWNSVAVAGQGDLMVALGSETPEVGGTGAMFISRDGGMSWDTGETRLGWGKTAASADGRTLLASIGNYRYGSGSWIFTSTATTVPGAAGVFGGGPKSELQLEYIGGGQFRVVNAAGALNIEGSVVRAAGSF